jgi:hypothetical protein
MKDAVFQLETWNLPISLGRWGWHSRHFLRWSTDSLITLSFRPNWLLTFSWTSLLGGSINSSDISYLGTKKQSILIKIKLLYTLIKTYGCLSNYLYREICYYNLCLFMDAVSISVCIVSNYMTINSHVEVIRSSEKFFEHTFQCSVLQNEEKYFTRWATISFSRRTLFYVVAISRTQKS